MAKVRHALPPVVAGTRCVPVLIPDHDAYVSLLLFAIRKMCQQSYFERDENRTAKQIADLLMSVTYQSVLDNIGTGCDTMADCDTIEDCLETSPTISAINTTIKDSTKAIYTNVNDRITGHLVKISRRQHVPSVLVQIKCLCRQQDSLVITMPYGALAILL